jgi:hypothetical protein
MLTLEKIMSELKVNSVNEVVGGGGKKCKKKTTKKKHCTSYGTYSCTTTCTESYSNDCSYNYGCY